MRRYLAATLLGLLGWTLIFSASVRIGIGAIMILIAIRFLLASGENNVD